MFKQVGQWAQSLVSAGVAISTQMYNGEPWGTGVSTSTINPTNWTRSYSRTGYLDPLPDLGNYDVLADAYVTRLIFDTSNKDNLTATGVEYTPDGGKTKKTIKVNKEVILSSGTIGSPAVLLHSGVGPKDVLSSAGVDLVSELPGVGQHLQDHFVSNSYVYGDWHILISNRALLSHGIPPKRLRVPSTTPTAP